MSLIIDFVLEYKYFYLMTLLLIVLDIILLVFLRPKKVKPIEFTIDDEVVSDEKSEIEKVIEALEKGNAERSMTTFEEEQEANAIISYQELVKAVNEKKAQSSKILEVESKEVDMNKNEIPEELVNLIDTNEEENIGQVVETTKFKNSEFISPIFGKDSNKANDDFLMELKSFRSNL